MVVFPYGMSLHSVQILSYFLISVTFEYILNSVMFSMQNSLVKFILYSAKDAPAVSPPPNSGQLFFNINFKPLTFIKFDKLFSSATKYSMVSSTYDDIFCSLLLIFMPCTLL